MQMNPVLFTGLKILMIAIYLAPVVPWFWFMFLKYVKKQPGKKEFIPLCVMFISLFLIGILGTLWNNHAENAWMPVFFKAAPIIMFACAALTLLAVILEAKKIIRMAGNFEYRESEYRESEYRESGKVLLEYSESQACFHVNYKENDGQLHNEPFLNDYRPITLVDEDLLENDETLQRLMANISQEKFPFDQAARMILFYLS